MDNVKFEVIIRVTEEDTSVEVLKNPNEDIDAALFCATVVGGMSQLIREMIDIPLSYKKAMVGMFKDGILGDFEVENKIVMIRKGE